MMAQSKHYLLPTAIANVNKSLYVTMNTKINIIEEQILSLLSNQLNEDKRLLKQIEKTLSNAPDGTLRVHSVNNNRFYSVVTINEEKQYTERYIRHENLNLAQKLANKEYCRKIKPSITNEIKSIESFLDRYKPLMKYDRAEKINKFKLELAEPLLDTSQRKIDEWLNTPYLRNPYPLAPEDSYVSKRGETVRSKNEVIIADIIYDSKLPYKVEAPLWLETVGDTVYPDFTILNPYTFEEIYVEVFGRMGDPEYAGKTFRKINKYELCGIVPGKNLLMFFEFPEVNLNTTAIRNTLNQIHEHRI